MKFHEISAAQQEHFPANPLDGVPTLEFTMNVDKLPKAGIIGRCSALRSHKQQDLGVLLHPKKSSAHGVVTIFCCRASAPNQSTGLYNGLCIYIYMHIMLLLKYISQRLSFCSNHKSCIMASPHTCLGDPRRTRTVSRWNSPRFSFCLGFV